MSDVVVEAAQVVVVDGVATATGPVRIALGADLVTGASATVDLRAQTAQVIDGTWTRAGVGVLTFASATVDLRAGEGSAFAATFEGDGPLAASGDSLSFRSDGTLVGERVTLTVCDCDGVEPWSVAAKHVEVAPDEAVRFRGGLLRVLDLPILPVPAGNVPLSRRSGLLAPVLGYGEDGLIAATPLFLTLGRSADTTITPEIRTARSARALIEQRYAARSAHGTATIAAGWDTQTRTVRGGVDADQRLGDGSVGGALIGRLTSDHEVAADYGDRFLARQQPWNAVRALAWTGPFEVAADGVQADAPAVQTASIGAHLGGERLFGLAYAGDVRATAAIEPDGAPWFGIADRVRLTHTSWLGPVRATQEVFGAAAIETQVPSAGWRGSAVAGGLLRVGVPAWRAGPASIERLEPGVQLAWVPIAQAATVVPAVMPTLAWSHSGSYSAGFRIDASPALPSWSEWRGHAEGHLSARGVTGWAQASVEAGAPGPAAAGMVVDRGPIAVSAAWRYAPADAIRQPDPTDRRDLHQVRAEAGWTLPAALSTVRIGGGAAWDLDGGVFLVRRASVRWTHGSGCLALGLAATADADRTLPDVALLVDLWPAPPSSRSER